MTAIDDAASKAAAYMKAAEGVVQAYKAMSAENTGRLQQWFPTLTTNVQLLSSTYTAIIAPEEK